MELAHERPNLLRRPGETPTPVHENFTYFPVHQAEESRASQQPTARMFSREMGPMWAEPQQQHNSMPLTLSPSVRRPSQSSTVGTTFRGATSNLQVEQLMVFQPSSAFADSQAFSKSDGSQPTPLSRLRSDVDSRDLTYFDFQAFPSEQSLCQI
jgi:hypothetical protein